MRDKFYQERLSRTTAALDHSNNRGPLNRYIIIGKITQRHEMSAEDVYLYDFTEVEYIPPAPGNDVPPEGEWQDTLFNPINGNIDDNTAAVPISTTEEYEIDERVYILIDTDINGNTRHYILSNIPIQCEIDISAAQEIGNPVDEWERQTDEWNACGEDPLIYWIDCRFTYEVDSGTNTAEFIKFSRPHHYTKDGRLVYVGEEVREVMFSTVEFACP